MGRSVRRTYLKLSFADEQRLFARVRQDGFVVLSKHLQGPDVGAALWDHLPNNEEADDWWDYDCAILPRSLVSRVKPKFLGMEGWLEAGRTGQPRAERPPSPYILSEFDVPMLSWDRNRPRRPGGELAVNRGWDYAEFQSWLDEVVDEYKKISGWIKRSTTKEPIAKSTPPIYRYVSRDG